MPLPKLELPGFEKSGGENASHMDLGGGGGRAYIYIYIYIYISTYVPHVYICPYMTPALKPAFSFPVLADFQVARRDSQRFAKFTKSQAQP